MGNLRIEGEVGFVREREGVLEEMGLWGGAELRWRDRVLSGGGVYEGDVKGSLRAGGGADVNALVVTGDLPEGDALKGRLRWCFSEMAPRLATGLRGAEVWGRDACAAGGRPGDFGGGDGMRHLFFPLREVPGGGEVSDPDVGVCEAGRLVR